MKQRKDSHVLGSWVRIGCFNFVPVIWANYLILCGLIFLWEKNTELEEMDIRSCLNKAVQSLSVVSSEVLFSVINFIQCIFWFLMHFKVIQIVCECIPDKYTAVYRLKSESEPLCVSSPTPILTFARVEPLLTSIKSLRPFCRIYTCDVSVFIVYPLRLWTKWILNLREI